jgi:cytidyltransferase-like protein
MSKLNKKLIILTSGYFNPIHPGHIERFNLSKAMGGEVWTIVNNDFQAKLKRGVTSFQDEAFRMCIVKNLKSVDRVFLSRDRDNGIAKTVQYLYKLIHKEYGSNVRVIYTMGGDKFKKDLPHIEIFERLGIEIIDGLGKKTHNSRDYIGN